MPSFTMPGFIPQPSAVSAPSPTPPTPPTPPPAALPGTLAMTPPQFPGLTNSVPVNLATGGAVMGATNFLTSSTGGPQATTLAGALTMLIHPMMPANPSKWGLILSHLALVTVGLLIGWVVFFIVGHLDPVEALTRGASVAVQAWGNHLGLKIGGIGGPPLPGGITTPQLPLQTPSTAPIPPVAPPSPVTVVVSPVPVPTAPVGPSGGP